MTTAINQPLAEALVKVKLVYDHGTVKTQANKVVEDSTKLIKRQIADLRTEANKFNYFTNNIRKFSDALLKAFTLPAITLGTLGLNTFLKTNEGVFKLRGSVNMLRYEFNQLLARIGSVIFNSGHLTNVMAKLRDVLKSIDARKIEQMFTVVKWATILGIMGKMVVVLAKLAKEVQMFQAAVLTMQLPAIIGGRGKAGAVAGGAVTGAAGNIFASFINLFRTPLERLRAKLVKDFPNEPPIKINQLLKNAQKAAPPEKYYALSTAYAFKNLKDGLGEFTKIFKPIGRLLPKIFAVLLGLDLFAALLRGFGADFKSGIDMIMKSLGWLAKGFMWIAKVIMMAFNGVEAVVETIGIGFAELFGRISKAEAINKITKLWEGVNPFRKGGGKGNEQFTFQREIGVTSFAGLQAAAQQAAANMDMLAVAQEQLEVQKKIAENTSKLNVTNNFMGSAPSGSPGTFTDPNNPYGTIADAINWRRPTVAIPIMY